MPLFLLITPAAVQGFLLLPGMALYCCLSHIIWLFQEQASCVPIYCIITLLLLHFLQAVLLLIK